MQRYNSTELSNELIYQKRTDESVMTFLCPLFILLAAKGQTVAFQKMPKFASDIKLPSIWEQPIYFTKVTLSSQMI